MAYFHKESKYFKVKIQSEVITCFFWSHVFTVYLFMFLLLLDLLDAFYKVHQEIHRDVCSEDVTQQDFGQ